MHNDSQQYGITRLLLGPIHNNAHGMSLAVCYVHSLFYDGHFSDYLHALLREHPYVCNIIVISVFKALQKHNLPVLHMIITILLFSHIHVRHTEPN